MDAQLQTLREAMMKAEAAFDAEVIRQFGAAEAGDKRYHNKLHDDATASARRLFHIAAHEYLTHSAGLRKAKGGI